MIENVILAGLNHVLGQSSWARAKLAPFSGRHARLAMPPWQLGLVVTADGLFEAATDEAAPDVEIRLPVESPLLALQGQERVMQAARVEGSAEFATELAYVLKNLRWDFEEDMSRVVGDIAAHRVAGGLAAFADWQKQAVRNLSENLTEYATEENSLVVGSEEFKEFSGTVGSLREDIERLERRAVALKN